MKSREEILQAIKAVSIPTHEMPTSYLPDQNQLNVYAQFLSSLKTVGAHYVEVSNEARLVML